MPIYEYECRSCGKQHEVMQKITDLPLELCPDCGGSLRKMISNTSFVLKGTGWYATDYASSGGKNSSGPDKTQKAEKTDAKKGATKTETKKGVAKETKETAVSG